MPKQMPGAAPLSSFVESVNMLIYGPSGCGKTVLAGSDPQAILLAVEDGTTSAARQGSGAQGVRIDHWDKFVKSYEWLRDNPDHGYSWVVIDSAPELQRLCLRSMLDAAHKDNGGRDLDIPAIQDYQKWFNMFERYVGLLNDLPVNVMWTAQVAEREDDEGATFFMPLMRNTRNQDMQQFMCAKMTIVGYMEVQKPPKGNEAAPVRRRIIARTVPPYFGKDRLDVFGPALLDPTLPKINRLLDGAKKPVVSASAKKTSAKKPAPIKVPPAAVVADDEDDKEEE